MPHLPTPPCLPASYKGEEPYVFVSYSHVDGPKIWPEISRLQADGFHLWYDEGIEPAGEWPEEIAKALERATLFLCFMTPHAAVSRHVSDEIHFALERNKPVLIVYWSPCQLPAGLAMQLSRRQAILKHELDEASYHQRLGLALQRASGFVGEPKPNLPTTPEPHVQTRGRTRTWLSLAASLAIGGALLGYKFSSEQSANEKPAAVKSAFEALIDTALHQSGPAGSLTIRAVLEVQLSGSASYRPLAADDALTSQDAYRIRFQTDAPAYIYLFQRDSIGHLAWMYPKNTATHFSTGTNPVPANREITLPEADFNFALDENPGSEQVYLVATAAPWPELEANLIRGVAEGAVMTNRLANLPATRGVKGIVPAGTLKQDGYDVAEWLKAKDGVVFHSWHFQHDR